jgi:hypothetical protein
MALAPHALAVQMPTRMAVVAVLVVALAHDPNRRAMESR